MRNFLFFWCFFSMISCNNESAFQEEIQTVDSLQTVVKLYDQSLDSIDYQNLVKISNEVDSKFEYVAANYVDSADLRGYVNSMGIFSRLHKGLNRYEEMQPDVKMETEYTRNQLKDLKNSLEDEKLSKEEAEKYLEDEVRAVRQLSFQFGRIYPEAKNSLYLWDTLGPRYDSIYRYAKGLE